MLDRYNSCFEIAKENYLKQSQRQGYPTTFFSIFRHTRRKKNKAVIELGIALKAASDDNSAKNILLSHLLTNKKFNNHSFNVYLLDQLQALFPDENWENFNPKPIVFYQGILYRGTSVSYDHIFKNGFNDQNPSENLDHYVSDCNGSIGVSMTKNLDVAKAYALPTVHPRNFDNHARDVSKIGYVYEINYRGNLGIDIEATQTQRKHTLRALLAHNKSEVNVPGKVLNCDIVRAWRLNRNTTEVIEIKNPNYALDRKKTPTDFVSKVIVSTRDFFFGKSIKVLEPELSIVEIDSRLRGNDSKTVIGYIKK